MSIDAPMQNAFRHFAGRIALIDGDRRWTFAELQGLVNAVAGGLSVLDGPQHAQRRNVRDGVPFEQPPTPTRPLTCDMKARQQLVEVVVSRMRHAYMHSTYIFTMVER